MVGRRLVFCCTYLIFLVIRAALALILLRVWYGGSSYFSCVWSRDGFGCLLNFLALITGLSKPHPLAFRAGRKTHIPGPKWIFPFLVPKKGNILILAGMEQDEISMRLCSLRSRMWVICDVQCGRSVAPAYYHTDCILNMAGTGSDHLEFDLRPSYKRDLVLDLMDCTKGIHGFSVG